MRLTTTTLLVLALLVTALAWAFWPESKGPTQLPDTPAELVESSDREAAEVPGPSPEKEGRASVKTLDGESGVGVNETTESVPVSVRCVRGILEFSRPEPEAKVQIWTLANEDTGVEAELYAEAIADMEGLALCQAPSAQGFEIRAESQGDQAQRRIELRLVRELERYFPNGIAVSFQSKKATIAVAGVVVGADQPVHLRLHAGPGEPAPALLATQLRFSDRVAAEAPNFSFESEIEVPAGFPMHLAVYSAEGERVARVFTGRALQAGEVWPCLVTIDLDQIYRDYYFRLTGDEGRKVGSIFGDVQVSLFDVETKFQRRNVNFPHEVGKVYSMRVAVEQSTIARVKDTNLGGAEWVIAPGAGTTEANPEVIALKPPVRILISKDAGDAALAQLPKRVQVSYPNGMPEGRRLDWLEERGEYTIFGPQIAEIQSLRLGDRLFRCNFVAGGDYRLGEPGLEEVPITETASVTFQVQADFQLDDSVLFIVEHAGLLWSYGTVQSRGSSSIRHVIDLPVGVSTVTVRYGASTLVQTFPVEVGVRGGSFPVVFSRS